MTGLAGGELHRAHLAQLDQIVARWHSGEISTDEKRQQIAAENREFYGRDYKSPVLHRYITTVNGTGIKAKC